MKGLSSRIVRLENSITCPQHKLRLTCPACAELAPVDMDSREIAQRVQSLFGLAAIRALPPEEREEVRERLMDGDQVVIQEYKLVVSDIGRAFIDG